ncbi:D-alanyl-D-alanine carboxypeptidase/D-alanyl-D-alanine-endopeptidase [Nocardioides sp. WL0053]|uniref:D-alanyl-D-alanine carboxypeptidase/D-alanyl-D-alanine-endopeptidase n=1 Tax=Nocardioides jiangsuensis TaxID=2866161 RepID=A0ABS7RHF8_9ACTN|nr:D-alanyl-D-alanine carboxypeptidase/D-alanyl-D-alanine-endopeptidase [Nocardioides jiangsuensis]MBY9074475.1 D-alanyl-D-alanine carboxypeptidase/D-alanyl-D-alanine-endopeptidase [Nocardioides jiangsuensis]
MARGDVRHSGRRVDRSARTGSGRLLRRATVALVVLVLVLAGVSYTFDLGNRWLGWDYPSPVTEPAAVAPPPGLRLPAATVAEPVAVPGDASTAADPAKVRRALAGLLRDKKLGPRVAVAVDQLSDGSPVFRSGPTVVTPASTMKLLTSAAALAALGQGHTFSTTVVAGATPRQVVLVGGGDPLLARTPSGDDTYPARADLLTLAKKTARSLDGLGRTRVSLGYDASLFTGPAVSPQWPASYLPDDVVSPISALWVDEGRERPGMVDRSADPALGAAQVFAQALAKQGIAVVGRPRPTAADAEPDVLAEVESAPLEQVVQWVLEMSDNEGAEVLFRHVALATDRPGSFVGGSAAVRDVLADLGIDTAGQRILDGSGLSRDDRVAAETLLAVVGAAADEDHPELRPVAVDLPVAGFTGSLTYRFATGDDAGLGRVRAKTGTLTGVHGLAGTTTDLDGTVLSFAVVADRVKVENTLDARATIDEIAAALAGCSCGA